MLYYMEGLKNLQNEKDIYKTINFIFCIFYAVWGLVLGIYNIFNSNLYYIMLAFASEFFIFIPPVMYKILKLKPVYKLSLLFNIFCFLAYMIGVAMALYHHLPLYDKFVHMLSGILFGLIGIVLYYILKPVKRIETSDYGHVTYTTISAALSSAVIWEIWEYISNLIFHTDPQNVLTTGINDTMGDMIACLLGSLILCVSVYFYYRRGKKSFTMSVFESFYNENFAIPE